MTRKPPANLVRPIVYPNRGNHEHRTSTEIAAINDETQHEVVQAELAESYRVAGIEPDGNLVQQVRMTRELAGHFAIGDIGLLKWEHDIEGGTIAMILLGEDQVVVSSTAYELV